VSSTTTSPPNVLSCSLYQLLTFLPLPPASLPSPLNPAYLSASGAFLSLDLAELEYTIKFEAEGKDGFENSSSDTYEIFWSCVEDMFPVSPKFFEISAQKIKYLKN
jgi:hypothetical protein